VEERGDLAKLQLDIETEKARLSSAREQIQKQPAVLPVPNAVAAGAGATRALSNPAYDSLSAQITRGQTRLAGLERRRSEMLASRKAGARSPGPLNELHFRQVEAARLETDYDVAKQVYRDLALRYEQSRISVAGTVEIVDPAITPTQPVPRGRLRSVALGLIAGALFGGLAALAIGSIQAASREQ